MAKARSMPRWRNTLQKGRVGPKTRIKPKKRIVYIAGHTDPAFFCSGVENEGKRQGLQDFLQPKKYTELPITKKLQKSKTGTAVTSSVNPHF